MWFITLRGTPGYGVFVMPVDVSSRVIAIIADVLEMERTDVKADSHFLHDLGASSLDIAELVWRMEDDSILEIGEIPDEIVERFETVGDVLAFIVGRQGDKAETTPVSRVHVAIASDHTGHFLKTVLIRHLEKLNVSVRDLGSDGADPVDYPEYAEAVAHFVHRGDAKIGVLVGCTGTGMAIAANKVDGIRAAAANDLLTARLSRQRYDTNILCLGASLIGEEVARTCLDEFLEGEFMPGFDGRYRRQVSRVHEIERRRG